MHGFRPRLAPTLITVPIVLLCLALGVWQVQRLHWKEALIAQRDAALRAPPAPLPRSLAAARGLEWRRVLADGVYLPGRQIWVHAIAPDGTAGFAVLAPLREAAGDIVFVDRSFVPTVRADAAKSITAEPPGAVRIAGRLRLAPAEKPGWFLPDNRPEANEWFWIDLPAMAKADGLANVAPFYVGADAAPPELPNNHLQYAATWFSLAAAALAIYVLSQRRAEAAGG